MDQIENYTPIKSKIILLLKALKKQEIRNLNSYLKPYIPIADWARLLKYLLKFHPEFNLQSKNLSQRIVFQRVFGGANFDSIKLTKKLYEAHQEVKKFLIFEKINEKNPLYEILLAREFHNRNLKKHFSALENQRRKKPMGIKSEFTFLQNFLWDHFKYFESTSPKMVVENIELVDANNNLNLFFIASTLKHACELLFRGNLKPEEHPIFFLEQVEKYCKSNELKLPILIHFYWLTFQLIKERDEKKYFILEKYFYTNNSSIKYSDRLIIITYLINFSSQKIRSNDKRFLLKAFSLYKYGMQNKIFIINQQFIKGHFLNILYLSCYLDEIEWIELFLHDSEEDIKGWIDPATLEIGKARLCFAKKDYDNTLGYLNQLQYKNSQYKIREQLLRIATHFEKKDFKVVQSLCISFNKFLKEHYNDHNENAVAGKQFIKIVNKLIKPKPSKSSILKILKNSNYVIFQDWIEEKIKNLN